MPTPSTSGRPADDELRERRAGTEAALRAQPLDPGVRVAWEEVDGCAVARVTPLAVRSDEVLLHLHGGGYRLGSAHSWLPFATRLSATVGRTCYLLDYPLAPESPFPAALDRASAAYSWVRGRHEDVVLSGDSAGGGLAAAVATGATAGDHRATVLLSPWLDLRVHRPSYDVNAESDLLFSRSSASDAARAYVPSGEVADPRVSPVLAEWTGQPPVFLEASSTEVLRDDARALAAHLAAAGVRLWFREVPGERHDWHISHPPTEASTASLGLVGAFLDSLRR